MHNAVNEFREQQPFEAVGGITSVHAVLAVDERTETVVDALATKWTVIYKVPFGVPAIEARVRSVGDEDHTVVVHVYAKPVTPGGSQDPEHYTKVGRITMDQGAQDSGSEHFVDVVSVASNVWAPGLTVQTTVDEIGRIFLNTAGYEKFLFIATAMAQTSIHIDIKRHDKEF